MELQSFVTRNFKPRENVRERGEQLISHELKTLPINGQVKVAIVDQGLSFIISGVAHTDNRFFSSESYHYKSDLVGTNRDWQVEALGFVIRDLLKQVASYLGRKKKTGPEILD